ncbi:type III pantothenate kinase [Pseudidiomarina indica]|uniref:Type III pantothenate kinase n=1 Tax=Pseudidiomarina indica TaxID=1159017 RepID=A0A1G6B4G3_9GAMM|nr:type III pantothenate kinase [Pseudidiomarina indica]SDB15527.1 type III pantothenate kinase [Pseudidiomarina indica]
MTHKLLLDAGNTRVKMALMDENGYLEPWQNVTYTELAELPLPAPLDSVWLACVSGKDRQQALIDWLQGVAVPVIEINSEASAFGVTTSYREAERLGVDRWLALVGAFDEQPKATVIVDAGTAITVDWLNEQGEHLGGWIAPGVNLMRESVVNRAPKVFPNAAEQWGKAHQLGQNTTDCLLNGCVNSFVGLVRQAIAVSETELDWFDYRILYSGGSIPLLPADLKRRGEVRSELVLQGLACYAREGRKQ